MKSYSLDLPAPTMFMPRTRPQLMSPMSRLGWSPSPVV